MFILKKKSSGGRRKGGGGEQNTHQTVQLYYIFLAGCPIVSFLKNNYKVLAKFVNFMKIAIIQTIGQPATVILDRVISIT